MRQGALNPHYFSEREMHYTPTQHNPGTGWLACLQCIQRMFQDCY